MKHRSILLALILLSFNCAFAEEAKDRIMTRAEVIDRISSSDLFNKRIGDLLNWRAGYDITKINRTNMAPTLSWIKVLPGKTPPDNRTIITLTAKVSDPSGPDNIKGVRADLSSVDNLPNSMLADTGLWGDEKANDGVYTLQTNVGEKVQSGTKDIPVAVANKSGWVAVSRTSLVVQINPVISEGQATPQTVNPRRKERVTLTARVENPGRQEDIKDVTVNLAAIGLADDVKMSDEGFQGDAKAEDRIYSVSVTPKENTGSGTKKLKVKATNISGGVSEDYIILVVQ